MVLSVEYTYHEIDITLDVYEKICSVVELMVEKENKTFDECYFLFASSEVYELLQNEESLMWSESAEYLLDEYYEDRNPFLHNIRSETRLKSNLILNNCASHSRYLRDKLVR